MDALGVVGGTGPQGLGLALRLAAAGEPVLIGSRVRERAEAAAAQVRAAIPDAHIDGCLNDEAVARTRRVVLTLPFAGLDRFLADAAAALAGKLVIDVVVPVARHDGVFVLAPVPGPPSVGELIQQRAGSARVVSAFKNVPAATLADLAVPVAGDVLLCGDDADARAEVAALVRAIPRLRPVDAGRLVNARFVEAITPLLLNVNRRYHAVTSIAIVGL